MNKKHPFLPILLSLSIGLCFTPAAFADEAEDKPAYVIPGGNQGSAPTAAPTTPADPEAEPTSPPKVTSTPAAEPTASATTAPAAGSGNDPAYVIPGGQATKEPENTPSAAPSARPTAGSGDVSGLDDIAFMEAFTLAFFDGITELTPTSASKQITAVLTKVPEERIGEAQWYLNGQPVSDHYSGQFPIKSGKVTAFQLPVVFEKGMHETGADVALEIRLNGVSRRIEKHITYQNYTDEEYDRIERDRVLNLVKPMEIPATLRQNVTTYADKYLSSANGSLAVGTEVIYADHYSDTSAYLYLPEEERFCWVSYYSVRVSGEDLVVEGDYSNEDKVTFVNAKAYASNSDYLIWINLEHQKVNLFIGEEGNWKLERVMDCATGANQTPTPTGITTYSKYENGWFNPTYYVKPVLYINPARAIAMHSILFHPDGRVQDGTLGRNVSHGCIRLAPEDINYLAEYVPIGTTVVVF